MAKHSIWNVFELLKAITGETAQDEAAAKRCLESYVYKSTDCGAWISLDSRGVTLGSIVEGSDAEVKADLLEWGFFTASDFNQALEWVDSEACAL